MVFNSIEEAIADVINGKMIIVVDDEDRENEGDLLMAAEFVTKEAVNFMAGYGRGLICMPMEGERLDMLDLHPMVTINSDPKETAFTVSVDFAGTTTGISAEERAVTIQKLISGNVTANDFTRPGHIFPLRSKEGGVLKRTGHTEAAVDLSRLAGLKPAGVICEIMNNDGSMARVPDLMIYAKKHNLKIVTIADLIAYRLKYDSLIDKNSGVHLPTDYGDSKMIGYSRSESGPGI